MMIISTTMTATRAAANANTALVLILTCRRGRVGGVVLQGQVHEGQPVKRPTVRRIFHFTLRIPAFTTKCTRNVLAMNTGMTMYAKCPNQYRTWQSFWVGNEAVERLMRTHANTMAAMSMASMGSWDALSNLVLRYRSSTAASATVAAADAHTKRRRWQRKNKGNGRIG